MEFSKILEKLLKMQDIIQLLPKIFAPNYFSRLIWRLKIQQDKPNKEPSKLQRLSMLTIRLLTSKKFTYHSKELENNSQEKILSSKIKEELTIKTAPCQELKLEQEWSFLTLFLSWLFKNITEKVSFLNWHRFILTIY